MTLSRPLRRSLAVFGLVLAVAAPGFLAHKPPLYGPADFSRAVFDRHGKLLRLTLSPDEKYRLYTPLKDISPQLRDAVLLNEDRHFYEHGGVNPASIMRAFVHTYIVGGRKIGASTITMQLARIEFGINSRTIAGKLWQMARALQLEAHYSKDELLEAYLNRVSYGYNVEGVGAASYIYFRTHPHDLTLPEALALAVIPQSPTRRRPDHNNPSKPALIEARNHLFDRWLEEHPDDTIQRPFFQMPLMTYAVGQLPFEAPHLTHDLLSRYRSQAQVTASIDLDTQQMLETILHRYVEDRHEVGINNASALLVDTRTMQAVASIGSADFADRTILGQVDGTRAKRSPGSTLKPFIYALALDQGLIHPLSVLGDTPVSFGSYTPDNFDKDFRGPITARDALRLSRNIPAVKLASQLRSPDLYDFLTRAGITKLRERKSYGLSLVLGGAEVTERELAALYATLANDGVLRPLVFQLTKSEPTQSKTLLSPEASFMVLDMLADRPRPYTTADDRIVYWKTGTSNGFRDAWTAGIFGHYALVVWVGNFDGEDNPALIGLRSAAPLFFAMMDAVNSKEPNSELIARKPRNLNIRKIDVCATTGDISASGCPVRASAWFIPGVSPIRNHDVYRKVLVDLRSGQRACRYEDGVTVYQTFEVWPSDLRETLEKAGIHKISLPPWEKGCSDADATDVEEGQRPVITSPQPDIQYRAHVADADDEIGFSANADGDIHTLYWFVSNEYLGTSEPGKTLPWKSRPGKYQVRVVDDRGRSSVTDMTVMLTQ